LHHGPFCSSYLCHKPSGQALLTLNGKDFCLGVWQSPESHAQYDRLIAEWTSLALVA
jgi:hypothetical protein